MSTLKSLTINSMNVCFIFLGGGRDNHENVAALDNDSNEDEHEPTKTSNDASMLC